MKTLLSFRHGLGDAVQFTIVLRHLKYYKVLENYGIESQIGQASLFTTLPSHTIEQPLDYRFHYKSVKTLNFLRPDKSNLNKYPPTKPARCLVEEFNLEPIERFFYYEVEENERARQQADLFIKKEMGSKPFGILHYQGNSSADKKNLSHQEAKAIAQAMQEKGLEPVLWDWMGASPLEMARLHRSQHWLWGRVRQADAGIIKAILDRASLVVGIDSGIGHLAGATQTPTHIIWISHSPLHCYDLADNVTHHLPQNLYTGMAEKYFSQKYKYSYYRTIEEIVNNLN